ncbi:TlpA disulfide reductase family protein [Psychroserpens ponticola]|uniref:TlpA disulfide reductase family protein n=1 Tax=Psychroserpens ponticola TaxID=2932268 RepID=A0ABY7S3I4_9FLAO|nr:TlpA disulfide reductase family protein [Psychroserpens ponticola]WCO03456.1 TlpA disulfide reductase family protein [Psychroserpens ponticola]
MKHIISILVLCLLVSSCKTEEKQTLKRNGYYISGTAPGVYNGVRAYLETNGDRGKKIAMDTAIVMNEKFVFEGRVDYPQMVNLKINSVKGTAPLIVDNVEMTISVDIENLNESKILGSEANSALQLYNEKTSELTSKRFSASRKLRSKESDINVDELQKTMKDISSKMKDFPFEFVSENKDNAFSILLLQKLAESKTADLTRIESSINNLSEKQKNSINASMLKTQIQIKKSEAAALGASAIGQTAPSFSAPNPEGKTLALNDVKGKLTLIDFWASWCKPCRRENPNVVKVYQKYHSKGLEIISVSLDGSRNQKDPKASWIKAIKDDNLTWSHVSNLKYFNDPIAKSYNIRSIPATFLLDQDGKIIAKNLRGNALEKKVAEYLN